MLSVLNPLVMKKILLNIFFSTFTMVGNHPALVADSTQPSVEPKPVVKPEAKPGKCPKSTTFQRIEQRETTAAPFLPIPDHHRRKICLSQFGR